MEQNKIFSEINIYFLLFLNLRMIYLLIRLDDKYLWLTN
jgi:hypothetical protein